MKLLKTDLQKFAETFVDPSLGLLTKGTKLAFKSSAEMEFVEVAAVKTIPDIGSDPEKVDVTSLEDGKKKSISGLQDSTNLAFGVVYKGENFYQLLDKQGTDKQYDWKITYPDGLTVTFKGAFSLKLGNAEVNKSMDYTITVVVSDGPDIAAPENPKA